MTEIRHVMPVGDLVEHQPREDCVCGPDVDVVRADGHEKPVGYIVTHHSLDGREAKE